jgi:hypothetical protein
MNGLPYKFYNINKDLGYLIGVLYGDGNINYQRIRIAVKDKDFILEVKRCLLKLTNKKLKIKKIKNEHYKKKSFLYHIEYNSVLLEKVIKNHYKNIDKSKDKAILSYFLRGCFDSEGAVDKDRLRIRFVVKDINYAKKVSNCLIRLGITHTFRNIKCKGERQKNYFIIRIYSKNCLNYKNLIGFSIGRKQRRLNKILLLIK